MLQIYCICSIKILNILEVVEKNENFKITKSELIFINWIYSEGKKETTVPLLDNWIYSGILNRVPQLIETAEQSQQKIKTYQNKASKTFRKKFFSLFTLD